MNKLKTNFNIEKYGPEWAILELICLDKVVPDFEKEIIRVIDKNIIDWGELLDQAIRHKLLPTLAYHIIKLFYTSSSPFPKPPIPNLIGWHLYTALNGNRLRINIDKREIIEIINEFNKNKIPICATKGITLVESVHYGDGRRNVSTDIDFLINPKHMIEASKIMASLGYTSGYFDMSKNDIMPHSRQDQILYKMNPDHLLPFVRLTNDIMWKYTEVDFSNSFTWHDSTFSIPIEDAFEQLEFMNLEGYTTKIPKLSSQFEFIFVCLHLYREAWFKRNIELEQDVNLMKFFDVIQLFHQNQSEINNVQFKKLLKKYKIENQILWVLEHTDTVFGTSIVESLNLGIILEEEFLYSAFISGNVSRKWKGTMKDRLHNKNSEECFKID